MSGSPPEGNPPARSTRSSSSTTLRSGRTFSNSIARLGADIGQRLNSSLGSLTSTINTEGLSSDPSSSEGQVQSQHGSSDNRERKAGIESKHGGDSGPSDQQTAQSQQLTEPEANLPSRSQQQLVDQILTQPVISQQGVLTSESKPFQQGRVADTATSTNRNVQSNVITEANVQQNNFSNLQTSDGENSVHIQNTRQQQQQLQTITLEVNSQQLNPSNTSVEEAQEVNNRNNVDLSQQLIGQSFSRGSQSVNLDNNQKQSTAVENIANREIVSLLDSRNTSLDASVARILRENQEEQERSSQTQVMLLLTKMNSQMANMAQHNERINDRMMRLEQKLAKHPASSNSDSGVSSPDLENLYMNVAQRGQPPAVRGSRPVSQDEANSPFSRMTSNGFGVGVAGDGIAQKSPSTFNAQNMHRNSNVRIPNRAFNGRTFEQPTSRNHIQTQHQNTPSMYRTGHTTQTHQNPYAHITQPHSEQHNTHRQHQPSHTQTNQPLHIPYQHQDYTQTNRSRIAHPTRHAHQQFPSLEPHEHTADEFMGIMGTGYPGKREKKLNSFRPKSPEDFQNFNQNDEQFGRYHSPHISTGSRYNLPPNRRENSESTALVEALKGLGMGGEGKKFRVYKEFKDNAMLIDRTDAVHWLVNLRLLKIRERWDSGTYRYLLERLWNKDCKSTVTSWFAHVSNMDLVTFEVAFIEKFGEGLQKILSELTTSLQGVDQTCEEFMDQVIFLSNLLSEWQPQIVPGKKYLIAGLATRFESLKMKELLAKARLQGLNLTVRMVREFCQESDSYDKLYEKMGILRVQRADYSNSRSQSQAQIQQVQINNVVASHMTDQEDSRMWAQVEECHAVDAIYRTGGYPLVDDIIQVRNIQRNMFLTETKGWVEVDEIKQPGACVNGKAAKHWNCEQVHVCPFWSLQGNCNMRGGGRCRHRHAFKNATMCAANANGICPHGAFCANRHKNDEYSIYFFVHKTGKYKHMVWKDHRSPHSVFQKER